MLKKQTANDNKQKSTLYFNGKQFPEFKLSELSVFEIKQLADKEAAYKTQCLQAIKKYKTWQSRMSDETDFIEVLYGSMEGNIYHDQMQKMIQLYWAVRKHFRSAFSAYIDQTKLYTPSIRMAA